MATFLCFRLHGPLAAWGETAVGQRRPSASAPTRSAVLGLVAASLGLRRTDADALAALDAALGFASVTDVPGELLLDYHTAQAPTGATLRRAAKRGVLASAVPASRREELSFPREQLETLLSQRQYLMDAHWRVALWNRECGPARWTLVDLAAALRRPRLVPYLGRKSCPLDLPMEPQLVEAGNPIDALSNASFSFPEVLGALKARRQGVEAAQWEGNWAGLSPTRTARRRDQVVSRMRWQFTDREEHQKTIEERERADVPQSD